MLFKSFTSVVICLWQCKVSNLYVYIDMLNGDVILSVDAIIL